MRHEPRAVLFDLDNTLYPFDHFIASGFRAVAGHLERTREVDATIATRLMMEAAKGPQRGRELQTCITELGLPPTVLPELIGVVRAHRPAVRLPRESRDLLQRLRPNWRLGIITNGAPEIQARKIEALGLGYLVDTVVYATEYGDGLGKPGPEPFIEALERLCVRRRQTVFVGDDERCDLFGASRVGLRTIYVGCWSGRQSERPPRYADAVATALDEVHGLVHRLIEQEWFQHVA